MAWTTPTLSGLIDRARAAFRAELPGTDAWVWPNNVTPTAKVVAGAVYELFGRLDWRMRQLFASSAEGEYLDRHAYELGLARRAATAASGRAVFTAAAAFALEAGDLLESAGGQQYRLVSAVSLDGVGTVEAAIVAVDTGANGNLAAGAALAIVSGLPQVTAEVAGGGIGSGGEMEGDDDLRARILFRKRNPPHGGAPADYVTWCKEVPGVTRVYVERLWSGAGTVRVFVFMDDLYAGGIPPAADVLRVKDHCEAAQPAAASVTYAAAVDRLVDVTVSGLAPDTATIRDAIRVEIEDMLRRRGRVAGIDPGNASMDYLATPFILSRSWIGQAVSEAADEASHVLVAPSADVPFEPGEAPVLGTLTFI